MGRGFAGEQLRLARLAQGLTLDELGHRVAATRQYLHQLETGAKLATTEMSEALADALGVSLRFFHATNGSRVQPEQCHFRKQSTTPMYITAQVLARGTLLDQLIEQLDTVLSLPTVNFPDIPVANIGEIEVAAEECRRSWGLGLSGPIVNMTRVVENAGAVVSYFTGISERVDALSIDRRRPLIIRNEAKPAACRLRFDIAHECGHLVMHRGIHTGDRETEAQAHRFASAFLFPRTSFAREFPRGRYLDWEKIFALKARWKISARAIIRRAYDLNIITADKYRIGNIHLNKTGQSKAEKLDDVIPMEEPELLHKALNLLETNDPSGLRRIAENIGLSDAMFEFLFGYELPKVIDFSEHRNVISLFPSQNRGR